MASRASDRDILPAKRVAKLPITDELDLTMFSRIKPTNYNLSLFVLLSAITRGTRFTVEAALLYWLGEPVREFIEKRLELVTVGFLLLVVAGFLIARYAF